MPNPRKPLTGKTFGYLKVTAPAGQTPHGVSLWLCHCHACGNDKVMAYSTLTYAKGKTRSCGCLRGRKRTLRPAKPLPPKPTP